MTLSHPSRLDADLIIGSRGSALALWQANWVKAQLEAAVPDRRVAIEIIKTTGDKILDTPLSKIGGKGLFTKEIEEALLDGSIDLAVHSLKDLPTVLPAGLGLGAITRREDVRDALIARPGIGSLAELPHMAVVGTSSLRRQSQLRLRRSDIEIKDLRGNVDTRLRKLREGQYDAIILAAAGITRLGLADQITEYLSVELMVPAVGQGALGIEIRANDRVTGDAVGALNHRETQLACEAERAFLAALGGGCQVPIAATATVDGDTLRLSGLVASVEGRSVVQGEQVGQAVDAADLGQNLAHTLLSQGARELLNEELRMKNEE